MLQNLFAELRKPFVELQNLFAELQSPFVDQKNLIADPQSPCVDLTSGSAVALGRRQGGEKDCAIVPSPKMDWGTMSQSAVVGLYKERGEKRHYMAQTL